MPGGYIARRSIPHGKPRPGRLAGHAERGTDTAQMGSQLPWARRTHPGQGRLDLRARFGDAGKVLQHRFNVIGLLPWGEPGENLGPCLDDLLGDCYAFVAKMLARPPVLYRPSADPRSDVSSLSAGISPPDGYGAPISQRSDHGTPMISSAARPLQSSSRPRESLKFPKIWGSRMERA
jgi:hypothetical protein